MNTEPTRYPVFTEHTVRIRVGRNKDGDIVNTQTYDLASLPHEVVGTLAEHARLDWQERDDEDQEAGDE
jgi:hypothetical protein